MAKGTFNQAGLPEHRWDLFPLHSLHISARSLFTFAEWRREVDWQRQVRQLRDASSISAVVPPPPIFKFPYNLA